MNSSKLNEWLQITTSLGVIAGLIIVGYEINQNTRLAKALKSEEFSPSFHHNLGRPLWA